MEQKWVYCLECVPSSIWRSFVALDEEKNCHKNMYDLLSKTMYGTHILPTTSAKCRISLMLGVYAVHNIDEDGFGWDRYVAYRINNRMDGQQITIPAFLLHWQRFFLLLMVLFTIRSGHKIIKFQPECSQTGQSHLRTTFPEFFFFGPKKKW